MDFAVRSVESVPVRRPSKRSRRESSDEHEPFDVEDGDARKPGSGASIAEAETRLDPGAPPISRPGDDEAGRRLDVTG